MMLETPSNWGAFLLQRDDRAALAFSDSGGVERPTATGCVDALPVEPNVLVDGQAPASSSMTRSRHAWLRIGRPSRSYTTIRRIRRLRQLVPELDGFARPFITSRVFLTLLLGERCGLHPSMRPLPPCRAGAQIRPPPGVRPRFPSAAATTAASGGGRPALLVRQRQQVRPPAILQVTFRCCWNLSL